MNIMNIDWNAKFLLGEVFLIWQIFVLQLYIIIILKKYYKNIVTKNSIEQKFILLCWFKK
jgi:hypothetical protein